MRGFRCALACARVDCAAVADPEVFPLDSYREAARYFRRPFTAAAVKHKVQTVWPQGQPTTALVVCYMDARLVVERLNLLLPDKWYDEYEPIDNAHMLCKLTVDGIPRRDIGEGNGKALYSDAFKRAAVKFGIGVSLYAVPKMILKGADVKQSADKKKLALSPNGEKTVHTIYVKWLGEHGIKAFGEPLDHGDIENAQGDYEAEEHEPVDEVPMISPDEADKIRKVATLAGMSADAFAMELVALGVENTLAPWDQILTAEKAALLFDRINGKVVV